MAASPQAYIATVKKNLEKALGKNAAYTRIKDTEKVPVSSFKPGKRNRYHRIPDSQNYGIIPQNRLFILDIDQHKKSNSWTINEQLDFFSDFFHIDVRKSLSVITQSGGVHIYLNMPENIDLTELEESFPKASLRGYNEAFSTVLGKDVELDADIRTGFSNGYVIGPGSSIAFGEERKYHSYILANESFGFANPSYEILTVSDESINVLREVVVLKNGNAKTGKKTKTVQETLTTTQQESDADIWDELFVSDEDIDLFHIKPDTETINSLRGLLRKKQARTFHQARAIVKASLHCCYDDYAIAMVCVDLGINKDSYRDNRMGLRVIMRDLSKFTPTNRYHSVYCIEGKKRLKKRNKIQYSFDNSKNDKVFDADGFREYNKKKLETKKEKYRVQAGASLVSPRVIDMGKVSLAILGDSRKKKASNQYSDAMNIVNYYVQPLSNVGSIRMLLAHADIAKVLNISSSRVSQAMRVLRDKNILSIAKAQSTGMAATYSVSNYFVHDFLTKSLKLTWGKYNSESNFEQPRPLYFNFADGTFRDVFSDVKVTPISNFSSWLKTMRKDVLDDYIQENYASGAASRYLVAQREMFAELEHVEDNENNENMNEVVESCNNTVESIRSDDNDNKFSLSVDNSDEDCSHFVTVDYETGEIISNGDDRENLLMYGDAVVNLDDGKIYSFDDDSLLNYLADDVSVLSVDAVHVVDDDSIDSYYLHS